MMKYFLCTVFIFCLSNPIKGQQREFSKDQIEVENVILKLFDGMREGDSSKVAKVFHKNVKMLSSYKNKEGVDTIKEGMLSSFLKAIGTPHDKIWDEKIWNTSIHVDGSIAQVWTDYAFYVGNEFSHCGVDAFDLIQNKNGDWKIIHLMDTRKKKNCERIE